MAEREVLFLLDEAGEVLWSDAGSASALPDSRERWEAIWAVRDRLEAIAHSHPHGPLAFSAVDESTMAGIDEGLGRALRYLVVAPSGVIERRGEATERIECEPRWVERMRIESGMKGGGRS
jgi:hypothetical protein